MIYGLGALEVIGHNCVYYMELGLEAYLKSLDDT